MAKKEKPSMDELFATLPDVPTVYEEWCFQDFPNPPIYYRREGKIAHCTCGKCAGDYTTADVPVRGKNAKCPLCGHSGEYEWKRITKTINTSETKYLLQRTNDGNVVVREYHAHQGFRQYRKMYRSLLEVRRFFLRLGAVQGYNHTSWKELWFTSPQKIYLNTGELYPTWEDELKKSNLKYCDVSAIKELTKRGSGNPEVDDRSTVDILIAYANNPAIEMYTKAGWKSTVSSLVWNQGKNKNINRFGKSLSTQLRLKDKTLIRRFVESQGRLTLLPVLQLEEKSGAHWSTEMEEKIEQLNRYYTGERAVKYLLKYMTAQQLINRVVQYKEYYGTEQMVVSHYYDYLKMREELGYDMHNEIYLHPKDLRRDHDQMVKGKNARADELYCTKKNAEYPGIEKIYKDLSKKYEYRKDGYIIRPAASAEEIVMEGRNLHHCVGRDEYLNKHNRGTSVILFLRKEKYPEEPYYTIEIQKNRIVQWYGEKDRKPDKEIIEPYLNAYVASLTKAI